MKRRTKISSNVQTNERDIFNLSWSHYLMIGLIFIVVSLMFYKVAFLKYAPPAHDTQQWRWSAEQIIEYNKNHTDIALWTDNMFSGMPTYLIQFPLKVPFLNNIFYWLSPLINWRILYLIFGGIGMYVMLAKKKFPPLIALFSALAFAFSCHYIGLLDIGHNTKLRAIMYIPWIFLCFEELRKNRRILSLGLLTIFLIDQLRVNHVQIAYYTYLMLFIYWVVYLVKNIQEKTLKTYIFFTGLFILAILIAVVAVANPYLSTYEYSHYTSRGDAGLPFDYATSWSFGIGEVFSFFVPYIYGGVSPLYWGPMGAGRPSTQTFHYMGIIVLYLAILAAVFEFRHMKIKALSIIALVSLFISFGKHIPWLAKLLMLALPFYNRFRVPATILSIMQFAIPVLAAYGLALCIRKIKANNQNFKKALLISIIVVAAMLIIFVNGKHMFASLDLTHPIEYQTYQPGQIEQLRVQRLDALVKSGMQSFGLLLCAVLALYAMVNGVIKKNLTLIIIIALSVFDLYLVNKNHLQERYLVKESTIQEEFPALETDIVLQELEKDELFRIFPFQQYQNNARWSYYHQNIGGYHGAKIHRYNDVLTPENLLYNIMPSTPINWNILNMLNVKYLIFNEKYEFPHTELVHYYAEIKNRNERYHTYVNNGVLPRAWFVQNHVVIQNKEMIIKLYLNNPDFNPKDTVILEEDTTPFQFNEDFTITMDERNIHYTKWTTENDAPAFMVVSEIYYPAGWNFYINGIKTEHYAANYILRGVPVPAGYNTIEMKFEPTSYKVSVILSYIGIITSLLLTLLGVFLYYKNNYGAGIVYKIGK